MADKRRRRKDGGGSEESDLSETEAPIDKQKKKPEGPSGEHGESEYESADEVIVRSPKPTEGKLEDDDDDDDRGREREADEDAEDEGEDDDEDYEDEDEEEEEDEVVIVGEKRVSRDEVRPSMERERGDGEESVDDDKDKKNPQYIPTKGMFYEHDDRLATDEEEPEEDQKAKKRIWKADAAEKWGHDKFLELEQNPKSKDELVQAYGYDIRNEDNAPRARRRRRYGRGPNKYTRNWEDESAYAKTLASRGRGGGGGGGKGGSNRSGAQQQQGSEEEFPALPSKGDSKSSSMENGAEKAQRKSSEREIERVPYRNETHDPLLRDSEPRETSKRGRGGRGGGSGRGGQRDRDRADPESNRRGGGGGGGGRGRGGFEQYRLRREYDAQREERGGPAPRRFEAGYGGGRGGSGRGGGGRRDDPELGGGARGRSSGQQQQPARTVQDRSVIVRPEDLSEALANTSISGQRDSQEPEELSGGGQASMRGGPKRYSHQRRGGVTASMAAPAGLLPSAVDPQHSLQHEMYAEGLDPALCSGPPGGPPFHSPMPQRGGPVRPMLPQPPMTAGPPAASFLPPPNAQLLNYHPHHPLNHPQFGHHPSAALGGVVVSEPMLAAAGGAAYGHHHPEAAAAVLLASPPPGGPDGGFAAVRGGVTYFNPTAQNMMMMGHHHHHHQQTVAKRPKAAIPIVDPSQKELMESRDGGGEEHSSGGNKLELSAPV